MDLSNMVAVQAKPFDLRRERKHWWKYMKETNAILPKEFIDRECPRTIKKYEKYVVGYDDFDCAYDFPDMYL